MHSVNSEICTECKILRKKVIFYSHIMLFSIFEHLPLFVKNSPQKIILTPLSGWFKILKYMYSKSLYPYALRSIVCILSLQPFHGGIGCISQTPAFQNGTMVFAVFCSKTVENNRCGGKRFTRPRLSSVVLSGKTKKFKDSLILPQKSIYDQKKIGKSDNLSGDPPGGEKKKWWAGRGSNPGPPP